MQYHAIKFNSAKHLFGIFSLMLACSKIWQSKRPSWETQRSLTSSNISNVVHHPRLASDSHSVFFFTIFTGAGKIYTWQVRFVLFMFVHLRFVAFLRGIFARFHADLSFRCTFIFTKLNGFHVFKHPPAKFRNRWTTRLRLKTSCWGRETTKTARKEDERGDGTPRYTLQNMIPVHSSGLIKFCFLDI